MYFVEAVETGEKCGLFDKVVVVQSNEGKKRVQGFFEECKDMLKEKLVDDGGRLYVCGCADMVGGVKAKMEKPLGGEAWEEVQKRVFEEVF